MSYDLNRYFLPEAEDLLGRISAALEKIGAEPASPEVLRELRRWTHTLKGAAQVVRREEIARTSHQLETVLDGLSGPDNLSSAVRKAMELAAEVRRMLVRPMEATSTPSSTTSLSPASANQEIEFLRVELHEVDGLLQAVNESAIGASGLRRLFAPLGRTKELAAMIRREAGASGTARSAQHAEVLAAEIEEVVDDLRRELDTTSDLILRGIDDLQARAESLRLVRAETVLQVLEQSARSFAAGSGKVIAFEAEGGELEFDAHLLIATRHALIQIVRNAVAHGIEDPDLRVSKGKPAAGRVRVAFRREGARNLVEVEDDGSGIDFELLRRQAVRRGWMTEVQAQGATSQELTEFLLRPGVTTAASANVMAGRGVGLDLVSNTVARLKGELRIKAIPGKGTTFGISVPATMNSVAVLIVRAGGMLYGLPRDSVRRAVSLVDLHRLADLYVVDGRPLPMASLAAVFGHEDGTPSIAIEVTGYAARFLLGVDRLLGVRQTVIHTLPDYVEAEPFVLGAAVDGHGQIQPIIDPALLGPRLEQMQHRSVETATPRAKSLPILVVDDSLTTRMLEQSILEMEGYSVDLASSAEDALQMASKRQYGLFLVDVEMPGMDGIAFVRRMRQDPALRGIPAILVTSKGSTEDRSRGLDAGAREYIVKSEFDQRHLLSRVRELMRARP